MPRPKKKATAKKSTAHVGSGEHGGEARISPKKVIAYLNKLNEAKATKILVALDDKALDTIGNVLPQIDAERKKLRKAELEKQKKAIEAELAKLK